jgi:uncharacterized protein (DUF169 family)
VEALDLSSIASLSKRLAGSLRLRSNPVGVKLLDKDPGEAGLPVFRPLRDFRRRMTLCQAIALARYYGWPVGLGLDDLSCPGAIVIFGLAEMPEYFKDGSISAGLYTETKELGAKLDSRLPHLPTGKFRGIAVYSTLEPIEVPDVIIFYGTPGQMTKFAAAVAYKTGEPVTLEAMGKAGSCSAIAKTYLDGRPHLALPGLGDRTLAWTMDDEMAATIPASMLPEIVEALEAQDKVGVLTYPPKPFLLYEFKYKNIPVIGVYYDRFLKELRGEARGG